MPTKGADDSADTSSGDKDKEEHAGVPGGRAPGAPPPPVDTGSDATDDGATDDTASESSG
jgi:hypothetical protein